MKHGMNRRGKRAPEYGVWASMWSRCTNPNVPSWKTYGEKGVSICDRWISFENFLSDMGLRPSKHHTLERKDNHLGYSPNNCCWATRSEQSRNTCRTKLITRNGLTLCLKDWSARVGLNYPTVSQRVRGYGWSVERALTEPINIKFRRKVNHL